jgi:hypothetical protein
MNIDSLVRFNSLVKRSSFLAQLLEPMCQLLTQISSVHQSFQASEGQSLGHLEESLKKPLGTFLAQALQQAAQQKADQTPPKCPVCGRKLTRLRKVERTVQTLFGEIKITRVLGRCSKCKEWFCPGDEALDVDSGYSPGMQEAAAMLASKMPLSEASAVMERLTGRKMPESTLDRVAKRAAQKAQQKRSSMDEQARLGGAALAAQSVIQPPATLVIMMDAWNIRERDDFGQTGALRKKGLEPQRWHWVWTGTVFGLEARVQKNDRPMILERAYVATRAGMEGFTAQLHAEALRHGLGQAQRVLVMGDGGVWIWTIAEGRFKEAVQRIDLYHIKQHLWTLAKLLHEKPEEQALWVRRMKNQLKRGQAGQVIAQLEEATQSLAAAKKEATQKEINYLKEHEKRMTYAGAAQRHEPCGTGPIESTCRQYQCRFKRPGQFWSKEGDEALLCLDNFWRNNRWHILFPHSKNCDPSKN